VYKAFYYHEEMDGSRPTMKLRICSLSELRPVFNYITRCFGSDVSSFINKEYTVFTTVGSRFQYRVFLLDKSCTSTLAKLARDSRVCGAGILIGWLHNNDFIPSTQLFDFIRRMGHRIGCSIIAKEQGVKAFLYGNDLLLASLEKVLEPAERGWYVAVLDSLDMVAIGIGKLLVSPQEIPMLIREGRMLVPVVKNVFDLGTTVRYEEIFY